MSEREQAGDECVKSTDRFARSTADGTLLSSAGFGLRMSRDDPNLTSPLAPERLICDLTQSWSDVGGGVGTYLRHKRHHILEQDAAPAPADRPGPEDTIDRRGPGDHRDGPLAARTREARITG